MGQTPSLAADPFPKADLISALPVELALHSKALCRCLIFALTMLNCGDKLSSMFPFLLLLSVYLQLIAIQCMILAIAYADVTL